jgi:peptidoglycan/LPS O-acetylase OafA/YrhL
MQQRIPELTGLRAIAVMMVVLGHAAHTVNDRFDGLLAPLRPLAHGDLGVRIFFVLSGFLITSLLVAEQQSTGTIDYLRFYQRRALRIWPASYVFLAFIALCGVIGLLDLAWQQVALAGLHAWNYGALLGFNSVNAAHPDGAYYVGHFWSLALEEQFYWAWPPVVLVLLRHGHTRILVAMILMIPLVRVGSYFLFPTLRGQLGMMLHTGVDPMLIGCLAAIERQRISDWIDRHRRLSVPVLLVATWVTLFGLPDLRGAARHYLNGTYFVTLECASIALTIAALASRRHPWLAWLLRTPVAVFVGTISYSLYLWQQFFLGTSSPAAIPFPFNMVAAVAAATVSYHCIERPFLRVKDRLTSRRTPVVGNAEAR